MTNAPRKNTRGDCYALEASGLTQHPVDQFTVVGVEGNICYARYDSNPDEVSCFIWRFRDGLNRLHYWDGRDTNGVMYVVTDKDERGLAF
jgi:hypothetical protein